MYEGMVVTVGNHTQNLLQLVNAVRCHDPRIGIKKKGNPTYQAEKQAKKRKWHLREKAGNRGLPGSQKRKKMIP